MEIPTFLHKVPAGDMDPLVGNLDNVVPWIDEEYCEAILEGAGLAMGQYRGFPGRLRFCSGRQGVLGSSPKLFRRLAFICVSLLGVAEIDLELRLEELVSSALN